VSASGREAGSLVAGRMVGGEPYEIRDPGARGTVVGTAYAAGGQTVADAVDAAVRAAPGWAATPLPERIAALTAARDRMSALAEQAGWAELLTSEQGKVVEESRFETGRAPALVDLFAELARAALEPDVLVDERGRREVMHEPVGPVAAITPWNWPVSLSLGKVVPALLAGNPVILKPAPNTPLTVTEIMSALAAELPEGALGVLQGGGEVGAALVGHPDIRKVVFTGSTANGARVYAAAADGIKNVTLELGGNDAALVLQDADLSEQAVASMVRSTFVTSGQVCWAIKRIYVHRSRLAEFTESFRAAVDRLDVGHGLDPQATMGPLNNEAQLAHVRGLVQQAEQDGATVTPLGARTAGTDNGAGNFHQPTVVSDIGDGASLVAEEQFGPVVPVLSFDDETDAVRRANATPYGLCASVWSSDREYAFSVARGLAAGQVYVNVHASAALDYTQGFGGVRQSGVGREFGVQGVRQYTEQRMISERSLR
jgi:aldehyde dehydrogenase